MQINIDVERITNKFIDQTINKVNPEVKVSEELRQDLSERMMEQLSSNPDDLERTVENLLLKQFDQKSSEVLAVFSQLSKLFGGINND